MTRERPGPRTGGADDSRPTLIAALVLLGVVVIPLLALSPTDASVAVLAGALGLAASYLATTWAVDRTDVAPQTCVEK
ncbi:hypothetical protein ACFQPA_21370 [Halomarina halobia]|uniref:Uncharacterized protein n=1 Tax=Halomarina halobia TaxID=3033386 RepID=A0ABD6AF39_9EURY|nr:hypothetical protein [Halomarina sp. PSR21]